jgi:hypothetical protein
LHLSLIFTQIPVTVFTLRSCQIYPSPIDFVNRLSYKIIKLRRFGSWIMLPYSGKKGEKRTENPSVGPLVELSSDQIRPEVWISPTKHEMLCISWRPSKHPANSECTGIRLYFELLFLYLRICVCTVQPR